MRILITGASGQLGAYLLRELKESSHEVIAWSGSSTGKLSGFALRPVNLTRPDVTVQVEVRSDAAYFFSGVIRGPGGLPLGTQGRAVCLISGGFDSAVAAWMMLKRGVALDYVLCVEHWGAGSTRLSVAPSPCGSRNVGADRTRQQRSRVRVSGVRFRSCLFDEEAPHVLVAGPDALRDTDL